MGDVVNLRTERKRAKRRAEADKAAEQRLKHGTTKDERAMASAQTKRAERVLDLHRLETGDGE